MLIMMENMDIDDVFNRCFPRFDVKLKRLAEKAVKGEIPLDAWQQLRADLQIGHPENKKKPYLVEYG